jgi:chromosome segregation ATPase
MAELRTLDDHLKSLQANRAKRRTAADPANPEEAIDLEREEIKSLIKLEEGRGELAKKLSEIEAQLQGLSAPVRRFSADERLRQRLAEYSRTVAKLRADGNEAAAQRAEADANEFARQNSERLRVEFEVMSSQAGQMRAAGREADAAQLEKALQARREAMAAADRAQAEFRAAPGDGPARIRPATNVDHLSREAILRRVAHFRQAQEHLQEVGRGELVEQIQREIDRLENRLAALNVPAPPAAPEIARLQAENEQLQRDVAALKQAVDRLTESLKSVTPPAPRP